MDEVRIAGFRRKSPAGVVQPGIGPCRRRIGPVRDHRRGVRSDELPLYNQDVEDAGEPAAVGSLKAAMARSDALLVATPEYNHGIPAS